MTRVVYRSAYNIGCFGLERLHPFDSRKYGRAWRAVRRRLGPAARRLRIAPRRPATDAELRRVHTPDYLRRQRDPAYVAAALELPPVRLLPHWLLDWCVLRPMRWATAGSILGAQAAFDAGLVVNLGGGYHHAKPDQGEGFCIYSDIGLAVDAVRRAALIAEDARVGYIDLDAHQGNGVSHVFRDDRRLFMFDMFNARIYPWHDAAARDRIDCALPVTPETTERQYLDLLRSRLPEFLDSIGSQYPIGFAIYNAGTDVFAGDPLGNMQISADGLQQRDLFVVDQLRRRGVPTLMLLSGGYTPESHRLVANSVLGLIKQERHRSV